MPERNADSASERKSRSAWARRYHRGVDAAVRYVKWAAVCNDVFLSTAKFAAVITEGRPGVTCPPEMVDDL